MISMIDTINEDDLITTPIKERPGIESLALVTVILRVMVFMTMMRWSAHLSEGVHILMHQRN